MPREAREAYRREHIARRIKWAARRAKEQGAD